MAIDVFTDLAHQNVACDTLQFGCWFNVAQLKTGGERVEPVYP
ncbi:MAG: hypothetical protein M0Z56_04960 [Desulfobacteraceae bacterium]|nr:hypothetical protein [Desulfobacteraceae bacterium]